MEENGLERRGLAGYQFPTWLVVVNGNVEGVATREGNAAAMARPFRGGNYDVEIIPGISTFAGVTDTKPPHKMEVRGTAGKQ